MRIESSKIRLLLFGALVVVTFYLFLTWQEYLTFEFWKENLDRMQSKVASAPIFWGASYFAAYTLATALSIPAALIFLLVSGALFGFGWGVVIGSFASTIGADLACLITRYFLADLVRPRFQKAFEKIDSSLQKEGPLYLFAIRLNPLFPYTLTNSLVGLTKMPVWQFHVISQLALFPATALYVNAGSQLGQVDSIEQLVSLPFVLSLAVLGIFPLVIKRILDKRRTPKSRAKKDPL